MANLVGPRTGQGGGYRNVLTEIARLSRHYMTITMVPTCCNTPVKVPAKNGESLMCFATRIPLRSPNTGRPSSRVTGLGSPKRPTSAMNPHPFRASGSNFSDCRHPCVPKPDFPSKCRLGPAPSPVLGRQVYVCIESDTDSWGGVLRIPVDAWALALIKAVRPAAFQRSS